MDSAHNDETVKRDYVLIPAVTFPIIFGLSAIELRVLLVLCGLKTARIEKPKFQSDTVRALYKRVSDKGISARKFDAALGVLQFNGLIEIEKDHGGGVHTISIPSIHRLIIPDQNIEKIKTDQRMGEGVLGGEGKSEQGTLFAEPAMGNNAALTREVAEKCLRAWANRTGRNPNRAKVTSRRLRMVGARLSEGWTPDDLYRAVAGLCYSQWHHDNGQDKIELALRNSERVEFCHDLWLRNAPPDKVAAFEKATGEVVGHRAEEIENQKREERERAVYAEQIAEADRLREEQERLAREKSEADREWDDLLSQGDER